MHHFVTGMCTFLLQNGALWDMGWCIVGYEAGTLQDLCDRSIVPSVLASRPPARHIGG